MQAGQKKHSLTPEKRDEIDRAMEATGGVRTKAAKILRMKNDTLKNHLEKDGPLRLKWCNAPVEETFDPEIHRPITMTAEEKKELALSLEEGSLAKGFRELGFKDDEVAQLAQIAQFTNGRLDKISDLTAGGMANQSARLMLLFNSTFDQLKAISENPKAFNEEDTDDKGNVKTTYSGWKKMKDLTTGLLEIAKEIRQTDAAGRDAMIVRAKIDEIKKRQAEESKGAPKVPGFGPPEVYGNPTFIQHVHNDGQKGMRDAKAD